MASRSTTAEALGIGARRYIYVIGGGGKTTLIRALAAELTEVVATTSTLIARPEGDVYLGAVDGIVLDRLPLTAARAQRGEKLVGYALDELDRLAAMAGDAYVLVEADGSRGRSLKAHAAHEPVVSARAEMTIAVVGLDCLGAPLDDEHVHRAALFAERWGVARGSLITEELVARALLGDGGYLQHAVGEVVVYLTKAPSARAVAAVVAAMGAHDKDGRVARVVAL